MNRLYLFALVLLFNLIGLEGLRAQVTSIFEELEHSEKSEAKVRIVQDEGVEMLVEKHLWEESKKKGIYGYRIRIFSDSGQRAKERGQEALSRFTSKFEDIQSHFIFDYPFYRLYVGDYRTRTEALKALKEIEKEFPAAFIVRTKINYPKL